MATSTRVDDGLFDVGTVLFGRAIQERNEAVRFSSSRRFDARQREQDATILTLLLTHAAVETNWRWQMLEAHVKLATAPNRPCDPSGGWPRRYDEGLALVAAARSRPKPTPLDGGLLDDFKLLASWRQFLQHADSGVRQKLANQYGPKFYENLRAKLAMWAIEVGDRVFEHQHLSVGGSAIGPSTVMWAGGTSISPVSD